MLNNYLTFKFKKDNKDLDNAPLAYMTLKALGSMRFRWNEENDNRRKFFSSIMNVKKENLASIELIHSKTVFAIKEAEDTFMKMGDGIIAQNKNIVPSVTVADCMPIYIYDPVTCTFGVLHSGWKGTGIVLSALDAAEREYGARREDFCIILGPHIQEECYNIESDRAEYFIENFGKSSVSVNKNGGYNLSLTNANLNILKDYGVPSCNIVACPECTMCDERFGSFRRETKNLPCAMPLEEKQKHFTVQAAFIKWN